MIGGRPPLLLGSLHSHGHWTLNPIVQGHYRVNFRTPSNHASGCIQVRPLPRKGHVLYKHFRSGFSNRRNCTRLCLRSWPFVGPRRLLLFILNNMTIRHGQASKDHQRLKHRLNSWSSHWCLGFVILVCQSFGVAHLHVFAKGTTAGSNIMQVIERKWLRDCNCSA
jgi:hypothetical protein